MHELTNRVTFKDISSYWTIGIGRYIGKDYKRDEAAARQDNC
jgi:hypothetical protein